MEPIKKSAMMPNPLGERGLCLLSLDGGGMRGLSSLKILQRLMAKINSERRQMGFDAVKPCEVFDLIGGTSTGGLIAIMLGRLGMDVDECITEYQRMISQIFKKKHLPIDWRGRLKGRFDTQVLIDSIMETMSTCNVSEAERLDSGKEKACKVFVCATSFETKSVVRLKSYRLVDDSDIQPTILEAARATSAATSFFDPAKIGTRRFVDGALGANNPVDEVWSEAQNIWCSQDGALEPLISCFVSIGTGHPGIRPMNEGALKVLTEDMIKIATETTRTAEAFESRHRGLAEQKRYFRFNVEQGLQDCGLEEHQKMGLVEAATDDYLAAQSQKSRLNHCVGHLKQKRDKSPIDLAQMVQESRDAEVKRELEESGTIHSADPQFIENINFVGRERELITISQHLRSAREKPSQGRICLWGPGGVGKTQLAASYALRSRHQYAKIFKLSARSLESLEEDFANIIYEVASVEPPDLPRDDSSKDAQQKPHQLLTKRSIRAVHQWFLTYNRNWLLIIDDVHIPGADINGFIPRTNRGDIIITSQNRQVGGYGTLVEVTELSPDEAVTILLNRANIFDEKPRSEAYPQAREIVQRLGCLALAVEHAGALIGHKGMEHYWESFHSDRITVLDPSEDPSTHHRESVFKTFCLSFDALQDKNLNAAKLLVQLSYLENTTVSEHMLLPNGKPAKGIENLGLYKDRLGYLDAVADLNALALAYRTEQDGVTFVSLHPLVHWMTRARLPKNVQWNWNRNAVRLLTTPLMDPSSREQFVTSSTFQHVVHVLDYSTTMPDDLVSRSDTFTLWKLLSCLLFDSYLNWHLLGRMEQLAIFSKHAMAVLEEAISNPECPTTEHDFTLALAMAEVSSEAVRYTTDIETPLIILKRFVSGQISLSAVAALDLSRNMTMSPDPSGNGKIPMPKINLWAMSLHRLIKMRVSDVHLLGFAHAIRKVSFWCVGRGKWPEALLLAKFSELPMSIWRRALFKFAVSPSEMVQSALDASQGKSLDGILDQLRRLGYSTDEGFSIAAMLDYCTILAKQQRYSEVETGIQWARNRHDLVDVQAMPTSINYTYYVWFSKALVVALVAQGRRDEAQMILLQTYRSIKQVSTNDNLTRLHVDYLMVRFHRQWNLDPPKPIEHYEAKIQERFNRMYASDRSHLLKAEGLAMGCILMAQGALEEAIVIVQSFVSASTEIVGEDHPLTRRAKRVLRAAKSEFEQDAKNTKNGDYWLHFGGGVFQREAKALGCWDESSNSSMALDTISWWEAAKTSSQPENVSIRTSIRGVRREECFLLALILVLIGPTVIFSLLAPYRTLMLLSSSILVVSWVAVRAAPDL
ncbi:hypothetical protein GJ744_008933 [Endocarpon pusillum]|uniref:PNPLA domain-containing protein n=1 Tax=Endocarpon pusillum TaxID=364733 RepID=A0A8H7AKH4_9EURO|nr:hypothetical protein GJ744_008933 [Endocarpon pusillum]